ncbi:MAG TPA: tetratricopeptide repeat protein, partial [Gemmatimonadales bacterium]|nr:tetratricopeptide repeat protein [Gemmatimonadales bacterium]
SSWEIRASLGHAYARAGRMDDARRVLADLERDSQGRYVSSYLIAEVLVGLGEHDRALHFLERAYDERAGFLIWLHLWPRFDKLRGEARFAELLRKIGLPKDGSSARPVPQ